MDDDNEFKIYVILPSEATCMQQMWSPICSFKENFKMFRYIDQCLESPKMLIAIIETK